MPLTTLHIASISLWVIVVLWKSPCDEEVRLLAALPPTAGLWRLLDVCLLSNDDPAVVKEWIPKLAPHVDYQSSHTKYAGFGELRQLHILAQRWPLAFDGFEEMYDLLVAAGADASFKPLVNPNFTGKTAIEFFHERCRLEAERQARRAGRAADDDLSSSEDV